MEFLTNIFPWSILVAVIAAAVTLYKLGADIRSVDANTWNDMVESQARSQEIQARQQEQINALSAELTLERTRRRKTVDALYKQIDEIKAENEKLRCDNRNLQRRIKELENGKGHE